MTQRLNITLSFDEDFDSYIKTKHSNIVSYKILSKSLDVRGAGRGNKPKYHYIVDCLKIGESFNDIKENFKKIEIQTVPIIIGAGPAGLFAALRFKEYGIKSIILERGSSAKERMLHIAKFWKSGELNEETNVCFGEGGAGLFSDGKLNTRIKSPYVNYVMKKLVEYGAPEDTEYVSNPHLGSNKIRGIILKIANSLREFGTEIHYNSKVVKILSQNGSVSGVELQDGKILKAKNIILATGHSARDVYAHLMEAKVSISEKDFAVGVRIEHERDYLDELQHGKWKDRLPTASYRMVSKNAYANKSAYTFCMCPGGYLLSSGTEKEGIVTNGMSNYSRKSRWSNSAIVVQVDTKTDCARYSNDVLKGIYFQRDIEKKAFELSQKFASGKELPAMTVEEFLNKKSISIFKSSSVSGIVEINFKNIFPKFVTKGIENALLDFDKKINGFAKNAIIVAPETRTSSPITIDRDRETLESTSHRGLYPCGEGAGFAGGITSAAVDGVRAVMSIIEKEVELEG